MAALTKLSHWLSDTATSTWQLSRSATTMAPRLAHKPRVLLHWLLTAHRAQIVLLATLLLMPSLAPEWIDSLVEKIAPPTTSEQFVRFLNNLKAEQNLEAYQVVTRSLLWGGSFLLVVLAFFLQLPRAAAKAGSQAQRDAAQAERLSDSDPSQSILLYQSALALTIDPKQEATLQQKIASLKKLPAPAIAEKTVVATSSADIDQTIISPTSTTSAASIIIAQRYRLVHEIGRGAMGIIHLAHDTLLERDVALKQLAPHLTHDREFAERFMQEARALAKLSHPNIVQVYDLIETETGIWIAMELIEGEELADRIVADTSLPIKTCLDLGIQLSKAMHYAHSSGVIHRDFKPANVLVTPEGSVKIMDFGLAKIAQSGARTQLGTVMGSPAYMSPEQAAGKTAGPATDIYALGVTLYLMTTGQLPFKGDPEAIVAQHLSQPPVAPQQHNCDIPDELEQLILQMLSKKPEQRPASMQAVMEQLRHIQGSA
jgi:serine/threonine protein kinase